MKEPVSAFIEAFRNSRDAIDAKMQDLGPKLEVVTNAQISHYYFQSVASGRTRKAR